MTASHPDLVTPLDPIVMSCGRDFYLCTYRIARLIVLLTNHPVVRHVVSVVESVI